MSAPACANASAIALPNPIAPPVTIATFPVTLNFSMIFYYFSSFLIFNLFSRLWYFHKES